jgi:hypothetical protein
VGGCGEVVAGEVLHHVAWMFQVSDRIKHPDGVRFGEEGIDH